MKVLDDYEQYFRELVQMVFKLEMMWDSLLRRIWAAQHIIGLTLADAQPIYSAPYRAGPKAGEFDKNGIAKIPELKVIEQLE